MWNAIASGLGTLVGAFSSNKNINKQIKAQQQENALTRQYNLMLAKQQNAWNLEQWNRENAYNDPSAQMQRLRNAGLNPDLMYQNGAAGLQAASSPDMTSGEPAQPVDMSAYRNRKTIGDVMQASAQLIATSAQIQKTKADAEKAIEETEGVRLSNIEQDFVNQMKAIDNSYYAHDRYVSSEILQTQWHQNQEQLRLLQSNVAKMDAEAVQAAIDAEFKQLHKDKYFQHLINQYNVTAEELSRLQQMTPALVRSANAAAELAEDNTKYMKRIHDMELKGDDLLGSVIGETGYAKLFGYVLKMLLKKFS